MTRLEASFSAFVVAHRIPGLLMFDRQLAGVVHHRDPARVKRDGFEHFNLQVLRAGHMTVGAPGEEREMHPGDVVLFDTSRPQRTVVDRADYVGLSLPRDVVEAALPTARHLHGALLPQAVAGLLGDFVLSLMRHAPTLSPDLAARSGEMLADLLAGSAGDDVRRRADGVSVDVLALQRARAEDYIDAHLSDPGLDAGQIAAALGLSRSGLYRAFAPVHGVDRQITARRIAGLRSALRRPGQLHTIASLANDFGFSSESFCSRTFKAAFGVSPGAYRTAFMGINRDRDAVTRASGLSDWVSDLR